MKNDHHQLLSQVLTEALRLADPTKEPALIAGDIDLRKAHDIIITFMDRWVRKIDKKLIGHKANTTRYFQLISVRGCTFEEFKLAFNAHVSEEHFSSILAFDFLEIESNADKAFFQASYAPTHESYVSFLERKLVMIQQFFSRKKLALLPLNKITHAIVCGKSGSGKSEVAKILFYSMVKAAEFSTKDSVLILDPHGDLSRSCSRLKAVSPDRLVFIDLAFGQTQNATVTLNPFRLTQPNDAKIDKAAEEFTDTFSQIIQVNSASLTLNMQTLLMPCIRTLIAKGDSGLSELVRFFDDTRNEDLIALGKNSPNPQIASFFTHQFLDPIYKATKSSLISKLNYLLQSDMLRSFFDGPSTVDLEEALNHGKIVICNLSSQLSHKISDAIGKFIMAQVKLICFERARLPQHLRPSTSVICDEFASYFSASSSSIVLLNESRKYGLHLYMLLQHITQLSRDLKDSALNNANFRIVGRSSVKSAKELAAEMDINIEHLKVEDHHFVVKLGQHPVILVKPPTGLIDVSDKNIMYRTLKETEGVLIDQLATYYRPWTYGDFISSDTDTRSGDNGLSDDNKSDKGETKDVPRPARKLRNNKPRNHEA